ncbi:amidoligase family protein [Yunchengibacter salinarum]|uniref:amidoligase family protein n=1 Tax=Yunchengibacter salinarum TaxID=3133399 RepID=UPI0035B59CC1
MSTLRHPPWPDTEGGAPRRVGVELEFADYPAADAARLVAALYGGTLHQEDPHRFRVADARWGTFTVELDTRFAHPDPHAVPDDDGPEDDLEADWRQFSREMDAGARELIGDAFQGVVPTEIVTPPVPWSELDGLDPLFDRLRAAGARGTTEGAFYAFGLHLNPEAARLDADHLTRMMRAYMVLSPWLREQSSTDWTRRLLPHANPFPKPYALKVVDPSYRPDLGRLIDDYGHFNPTRNRELDMWPLFRHLDPARVDRLIQDGRIKARPTFHYRLPDMRLAEAGWSAVTVWNSWMAVESLAADPAQLEKEARAFIQTHGRARPVQWLERLMAWWEGPDGAR